MLISHIEQLQGLCEKKQQPQVCSYLFRLKKIKYSFTFIEKDRLSLSGNVIKLLISFQRDISEI